MSKSQEELPEDTLTFTQAHTSKIPKNAPTRVPEASPRSSSRSQRLLSQAGVLCRRALKRPVGDAQALKGSCAEVANEALLLLTHLQG